MAENKPWDLRQRTFAFAVNVVRFSRRIERQSLTGRHIAFQLLKAGTSVGANIEEANWRHSRRDFACKNAIALREAREVHSWLRLTVATALARADEVAPLMTETHELIAILTTVVRGLQSPPGNQ